MIDVDKLLAAAATQVHRTRCEKCNRHAPSDCWGFDEVDVGIATAVLDTALKHLHEAARLALWAAHRTITP